MGNNISNTILKNCSICMKPIPEGPFLYLDMVCAKLHYHNDCIQKQLNGSFICNTCYNISNNSFNIL